MVRICNGCGGVLGRDCFNELECINISNKIAAQRELEQFGFILLDTGNNIEFLEDWKQSMLEDSWFEI